MNDSVTCSIQMDGIGSNGGRRRRSHHHHRGAARVRRVTCVRAYVLAINGCEVSDIFRTAKNLAVIDDVRPSPKLPPKRSRCFHFLLLLLQSLLLLPLLVSTKP